MTPTNSCLDGETLAAWVDGGLARNDAAMAEAHVSTCPRCQEIAGLVVKTTPAAIVDPPWWRRRAAWLIPATVGVTAAGLLMIAPADPTPPRAAPTLSAPTVTAPPASAARESTQKATAQAAPPAAPPAEARPGESRSTEMKKERQREERATAADQTAAPAAPPLSAAPPAAASAGVAPAATSAPAGRVADQLARQSFAQADKHAVSPDGKLHWRITDLGAVERSSDGGTTWQAMNVGVTATFTTVQAPEPRTALVRTSDGRVFRTTDGGTSWQLVAPKL